MKKDGRTRVIDNYRNRIKRLERSIKVIQDIPLGKPIRLQSLVWLSAAGGKWKRKDCTVAGIGKHFNGESIRMELIAVEVNGYPFDRNKPVVPVKFSNITSWEPLPRKDLPLLIGYDLVFDGLTNMLKKR